MAGGIWLLADTSVIRHLCRFGVAETFLDHVGAEQVFVVRDVADELEHARSAGAAPGLDAFMRERSWPAADQVRDLDPAVTVEVVEALAFINTADMHPKENIGEIATVLYASRSEDCYQILVDDGAGKKLAESHRLDFTNTCMIAEELVELGLIDPAVGQKLWCEASRGSAEDYTAAIRKRSPEIAKELDIQREAKQAKRRERDRARKAERKAQSTKAKNKKQR
ncbi:MAG TPA: hypothetical protein PKD59_10475 [Miltoncostaeaceae bacterium]|nr:hypothetical protein [Miltoncostaeaceae bacterium]